MSRVLRVLICPDKFKGSLSAGEAAAAIAKGVRCAFPDAVCDLHPLADGGEGSLAVLSDWLKLEKVEQVVSGPLGDPVCAAWYRKGGKALIELADASGLTLVGRESRDPMLTTTLGTGELIKVAVQGGVREVKLFLGGSATNDGGTGIAHALGFRFLDEKGRAFLPTGGSLSDIRDILPPTDDAFEDIRLICLCDVQNPLLGKNGASHIFAPQKGASPADVEILEAGMVHFARMVARYSGRDIADIPGGGAAGGIAAGLHGLLGAEISSGLATIFALTHFEEKIRQADIVVSGEGKLDAQTLGGKVVSGVMEMAQKYDKPVVLFTGQSALDRKSISPKGLIGVFTIIDRSSSIEEAMTCAAEILEILAEDFFRSIHSSLEFRSTK
ncbi:MAG: hypothetical protein RL386_2057 [Bacteroidota bacterium]|jgi:glycerate kinase